jgi:hypothetical protein
MPKDEDGDGMATGEDGEDETSSYRLSAITGLQEQTSRERMMCVFKFCGSDPVHFNKRKKKQKKTTC